MSQDLCEAPPIHPTSLAGSCLCMVVRVQRRECIFCTSGRTTDPMHTDIPRKPLFG